jgi:hypothetical protein
LHDEPAGADRKSITWLASDQVEERDHFGAAEGAHVDTPAPTTFTPMSSATVCVLPLSRSNRLIFEVAEV